MKRRLSPSFVRSLRSMWLPLALAVGFIGGMWTGGALFSRKATTSGKLDTVMQLIATQYVDEIDPDSLVELTIPDLLARLDPHSVYIPASDLQSANDELAGSFSGIGITFQLNADTITVVEVIAGGPAEKVGVMAGDRIVAIDDSAATGRGWTSTQVQQRLRGPENTKVKLGIRRSTSKEVNDYTVTRGQIPVTSIDAAYIMGDSTGYIKVNRFGAPTYSEFLTALTMLRADGARSFIIDLRGNGGGYMEPAILMANEFLPAGATIVSTRGRLPGNDSCITADGLGSFADVDVAVLLDEFSASASEIFAGAIQDNDRGLVVGRRSFGKGLVQNQVTLDDSSAVRLTVARYYTPSGRCIQKTYKPGHLDEYNTEILDRYARGESYSADSVQFDKSLLFATSTGRQVYGGGGIMPDVFVPNDTTGVTSWYLSVLNAGLMPRFAFDYADSHRQRLSKAADIDELLAMLPPDGELIYQFARYAQKQGGVTPRWGLINTSTPLVVTNLKALLARDLLGMEAFYMILNEDDETVARALDELDSGHARAPLQPRKASSSQPLGYNHEQSRNSPLNPRLQEAAFRA